MDLQKLLLQDLERRAGTKSARRIAALIDEKPGAVSKWMHGQQMRNDILARIAGKMGWNLDRARPDYDPAADLAAERERLIREVGHVAESPASYRLTAPVFDGGPAATPRPVRVSDDQDLGTLSRDVIELRAMLEDLKARTIRPEGPAPRAALYVEATGEVILDPAAPPDATRRVITSAAGLEEFLEIAYPAAMQATKGPLIIARSDNPPANAPEPIRVFREPRDPRPRPGMTGVIARADNPDRLSLRTLKPYGSPLLMADGLAPGHDMFPVDPATATIVALLVAKLP